MILFSVFYWVFFLLTLPILFVPAVVIWLVTIPFDRRRVLLHLYSCLWGCFYIYMSPIWKVRVSGRHRVPWRGSVVIVTNHASLVDILVLFALYRPYKWVSKQSNFKLPIIGWLMRMNRYVPLVRGNRESILRMMEICRNYLNSGSSVLIFPEGTRSKTADLQPFKNGAFQLAMDTRRPIVPVAVSGTARSLPKHGLILRDTMDAHVDILEPLLPQDFENHEQLRDAAHAAIADALRGRIPRELDEAV
ncbi:MAG: lysophospholipid acyltransferase family protein [Actinomycetota bacterium]